MSGNEFKERIQALGLVAKTVAKEMGVTEQCMTSYYQRTTMRRSTLHRADQAILRLTNGQHGIYESFGAAGPSSEIPIPDAAASGDPAPIPDQQQALDYAARQVATMSRRLSDSLVRLEAREDELDKKEARMDALMERLEHRLSVISRYISANLPGAEPFIGNLDMAAEAPAPQDGKDSLYLDPLPPLSDDFTAKLKKGNEKNTK